MKNKTFNKKLLLNKSTVAHLADGEMNAVKGGATEFPCPTGLTYCITICGSVCPSCMETIRTCPP